MVSFVVLYKRVAIRGLMVRVEVGTVITLIMRAVE